MARTRLSPADAVFVYGETREAPQHVGSLLRFSSPPGARADFLRAALDELRGDAGVASPWNRRLATPRLQYNPVHTWVPDDSFDLDYHVRRTAVPAPGDERELGILVARLHGSPLDLTKPPWELHLMEGLEDGGFGMYVKVHHALVDGYTFSTTLQQAFSPDSENRQVRLFFHVPIDTAGAGGNGLLPLGPAGYLRASNVRSVLTLQRALTRLAFRRAPLVGAFDAPNTIFNQRITRNRRFATQQYPLTLLKRLGKASGATLNDVALAVCGGALRRYLLERGDLPDKPLVAFVPVNVRPQGDPGGGNAVGGMLTSLATDVADPVARLQAVRESTTQAKQQFEGMTREQIVAYSQALLAPSAMQMLGAMSGLRGPQLPRNFNIVVSNVPGPPEPLYFQGARMDASYPLSIVNHGFALNVTLFSYAGNMHVGFTGCRDTVPHLQRLAVYTGQAVAELDDALTTSTG